MKARRIPGFPAGLICVALGMLCVPGAGAATLGQPVLESGIGQPLRVVLPVVNAGRERLTHDCIKLRKAGQDGYDVSDQVRADVVERGPGQAVVLSTVASMTELIVSLEVSVGCGTYFSRRYTFLLDLPKDAPPAPVREPVAAAQPAPAPEARRAPSRPRPRESRPEGPRIEPPRLAAKVRPEDEPGVLPRKGAKKAEVRAPAPAPVPAGRGMLKIDIGGLNEFLTEPRSAVEALTGMKLAGELTLSPGGKLDTDFKLAHRRFLAALKDGPDPMVLENAALGQRLDGISKDLAGLKLDLKKTRERADELEASRVPWWWLAIAVLLSVGLTFAAMLLLRRPEPRQLILVDPKRESPPQVRTVAGAATPPPPPPAEAAPAPVDAPAPAEIAPIAYTPPAPDVPAPAPEAFPKGSLTQQLRTLDHLPDEAWASYRHPSDSTGVAIPFSAGKAVAPTEPEAPPAPPAAPPVVASADAGAKPVSIEDLDIRFEVDNSFTLSGEMPKEQEGPASPDTAVSTPAAADAATPEDALFASLGAELKADPFTLDPLELPADLAAPATPGAAPKPITLRMEAPNADQAVVMHGVMSAASSVMEAANRQMFDSGTSSAMKTLGKYIQSAPAKAPPGPWVMLAHLLHHVGMRSEYVALQTHFKARFGADLPSWDDAYRLQEQQLGLARAPGIETLVNARRGQPSLIGSLAGVAYRIDVPPETLYDLKFHREVLRLAAQCRPGNGPKETEVDFEL